MEVKNRAKNAFLNSGDVPAFIERGELDAFDVVFTRDTHENLIISPELSPVPVQSRIYTFPSVSYAEQVLSRSPETYSGQIVAILHEDHYVGYIVNRNAEQDGFSVTSLSTYANEINYDTLGSRPVVNLTGTLAVPVILASLSPGLFHIDGQYQIAVSSPTTYLSSKGSLFLIDSSGQTTFIKRISANEITDFVVAPDQSVTLTKTATEEFLASRGYVTWDYVSAQLLALDYISKEEVTDYVSAVMRETAAPIVTELLDQKLASAFVPITPNEVELIFHEDSPENTRGTENTHEPEKYS